MDTGARTALDCNCSEDVEAVGRAFEGEERPFNNVSSNWISYNLYPAQS